MAGFFSLGGSGRGGGRRGGGEEDDDDDNRGQQNQPPPPPFPHENWFWYRSDENPYKGFELWQHQQHHQQQELYHQQQRLNLYSPAAGLASGGSSMNVSDESSSRSAAAYMSMRPSGSGSSSGSISCQDCGNQAKKDCAHMRCRTCCKSRGFDCRTHVRSTWVPVSKRRERQQQLAALHQQQQQEQQDEEQEHRRLVEFPKRHKETPASTSGLEVGDFPAEVRTEAAFRCVRVSSIDNIDEAQVAYQTSVNIGGHLFKGILYDQGPDNNQTIYNVPPRETSGDRDGDDGSGGGGATGATSTGGGGSYVDPSSFYPTPFNTFMSGTQFFPNEPRS